MRYVLDSSVAVKWVLSEAHSDKAAKLQAALKAETDDVLAPDVWSIEVAHALTKSERRGLISVGSAIQLLAAVLTTRPTLYPTSALLQRAVEISSQARAGVYDCLYIALAEQEQCDLITADERLVNMFRTPNVRRLSTI